MIFRRLASAFALLCLCMAPAYAQKSKTTLLTEIGVCIPDQMQFFITPAIVRGCLADMINSWQQYASVNSQQGTNYAVQQSDYGQLIRTSNSLPVAISMPQATGAFATFNVYFTNAGTGTVTITPVTSTINGSASFALGVSQSIWVVSDGTNYQVWSGGSGGSAFGSMAVQNANNVNITGGTITGLPSPTNPSDAATKAYVDAATSAGLTPLPQFAFLATAAVLPNSPTYSNGTAGVGATLTAGSNSTLTVDGTVAPVNSIILVNNQAAPAQNGVYSVTTAGSGSAAWVLTRVTFFNTSANMLKGSYIFVTNGSTQNNSAWTLAATVTTVGTTAVNFNPFSQISGISATGVTYTASGGTARTQATRNAERVYVTDYGAVCNGTTDDTTAINTALSNVSSGGTIYFPNSLCGVSSTITRTTPINIVGAGMYTSGLIALATMPTSSPLFEILPPTSTTSRGYSFINMSFINTIGAAAFLVSSNFTTTSIAEVVLDKVVVQGGSGNANSYGILLNNSSAPNGGIFNFTFKNGIIFAGAFMVNAGDTLRFQNNIITGPNGGVAGTQVSGAGNLLIEGNNISSAGGSVVLGCAVGARIFHNELEQQVTSTEVNGAIIDLTGSACTVDSTSITENQIQAVAGIGTPLLVHIGTNVTFPYLAGNRLGTPTSYTGVNNNSLSFVCGNNEFLTGTPHVSGTAPAATWGNGC